MINCFFIKIEDEKQFKIIQLSLKNALTHMLVIIELKELEKANNEHNGKKRIISPFNVFF